ncbi:MAG: 3-oxoadipate enol-lactonase [Kineosporiaceae bacterium]
MTAVPLNHTLEGPAGAPVVVMAPSLGSTMRMWDPQAAVLARTRRVLRFDTRGHGGSPAPPGPYEIADLVDDLVALLDRLGIERADLVGLSLGGMTSLLAAATHPDRVERVAVLCTSALLGPASAWADRAAAVRAGGTAAVAEAVVDRWFTPEHQAADAALVAWARAMVAAVPAEGYVACCGAIERMDLRPDLGRISAPLLAIAGREDLATPPPHLELIASAVRGARLVVLDDAAHLANLDQPDAVTRLLLEHLDGRGGTP